MFARNDESKIMAVQNASRHFLRVINSAVKQCAVFNFKGMKHINVLSRMLDTLFNFPVTAKIFSVVNNIACLHKQPHSIARLLVSIAFFSSIFSTQKKNERFSGRKIKI